MPTHDSVVWFWVIIHDVTRTDFHCIKYFIVLWGSVGNTAQEPGGFFLVWAAGSARVSEAG